MATERRNNDLENKLQAYQMYLNHVAWCVAALAPELVDALESRGKEWIAVGEEMRWTRKTGQVAKWESCS